MNSETNILLNAATNALKAPQKLDEKSKAKLQKAARDFEAMFVNYLLKNLRESTNKINEDKESDGFGGEMMQEMMDFELAKHISRTSNFGIAEAVYKNVTNESLPNIRSYTVPDAERTLPKNTNPVDELKKLVEQRNGKTSTPVKSAVEKYEPIIQKAAEKYNVDSTLIKAVIASESAGNPRAASSANAKGLMQLIDSTAAMVGVKNVWDPEQNIFGGTKYLKQLLDTFDGDVRLAVASYNAGPQRVIKHGTVPPIAETQNYVKRVFQFKEIFSEGNKK